MTYDIMDMVIRIPRTFWKAEMDYLGYKRRYLADEFDVEIVATDLNISVYVDGKKHIDVDSDIPFLGGIFAFQYKKLKRFLDQFAVEVILDESLEKLNSKLKDLGV